MLKHSFETFQAVVERLRVCLVFLNNVVCLGSSKLAARFRIKPLAISTIL